MTKIVNFKVAMSCGGCSGAVTRILGKIAGVEKVDPNLETKIVTVTCDDSVVDDTLLQALLTWGKASNKTVELLAS